MHNDMGLTVPLSSELSVTGRAEIGFANAGSQQAEQAVWKHLSASRGESSSETASQTSMCRRITWGDVKMQGLIPKVWGRTWDSAFLARPRVVRMLLVHYLHSA